MRCLLKLWLLAVMALALPLQGFAAAAWLHCGLGHQRAAGGHEPAAHAATLGSHQASGTESHHGGERASSAEAVDGSGRIAGADHAADPLRQQKCSACSACCTAAALLGAVPGFEGLPVGEVFAASGGTPAAAFCTEGPERPPRRLLV